MLMKYISMVIRLVSQAHFPRNIHTAYNAFRNYYLPKEYINFNGKNLLAVRVFDSEIEGGIIKGDIGIFINENDRDLTINLRGVWDFALESQVVQKLRRQRVFRDRQAYTTR